MPKGKVSIYIDADLWRRAKQLAAERNISISGLVEELLREELQEPLLKALSELAGQPADGLTFRPVRPLGGSAGELVREMRDEREDRQLGQ